MAAKMLRHMAFLKLVAWHSITAFGGPQGHYGMMLKRFVHRHRYVTETELGELNTFVQLLPGASSTQTLMLIGYKRGGIGLAVITMLIWMFPAGVLMSCLSFIQGFYEYNGFKQDIFKFIHPMAIGFLVFATFRLGKLFIKNSITWVLAFSAFLIALFIRSPWIFPILMIMGGIITNFSRRRIPQQPFVRKKIVWGNIWLFVLFFVLLGFFSEWSRKQQLRIGEPQPQFRIWNLSENFYRFGSLVFGGGDVLVPLMYEQFVLRPQAGQQYMSSETFLTGTGMVRAIPGPVFSVAAYHGGMAMRQWGFWWQLIGCMAGLVFIFLPSALLVLFFYPVWNNVRRYALVYRSLEGINAVVVGIMAATSLYVLKDLSVDGFAWLPFLNVGVLTGTFFLLQFTKIPSPLIVVFCLSMGFVAG